MEQLIRHGGPCGVVGAGRGFWRGFWLRSPGDRGRFGISAAAADMMRVRCELDLPLSWACLSMTVRSRPVRPGFAGQTMSGASSEPGPCGTSKACDQAGRRWSLMRSGDSWCRIWPEGRAIAPDPMKNDRDAACEGDHRDLTTTTLREPGSPCS